MVNRIRELEFIRECVERRRNLLLLGPKGAGKTYLLKSAEVNFKACYIEHLTVKNILEKLVAYLKVPTARSTRYMTIEELLGLVLPVLRKRHKVILLDNAESISKPVARLLEKLADQAVVLAAAQTKPWAFRFREELVLTNLPRKDAKELAAKLLNLKDAFVLDLVATKSLGNPGKICEICREFSIAVDRFDVDLLDRNSIARFFLGVKPHLPERINIFPVWALFVVGFGFLIFKYFFYSEADWNTGYMVAAMGYTSLIIYKLVTEGRRR
jgi:hypothetical protein